ncbi:nitroreductase family protein [bacterium]|jgi:nitroreductase|nr:nitroreductase family protein [bacterium]MBT6832062.1 nitroreductase family protein [bacterium]MBT6995843.1 nitroreductase family protein [bacterium]MBT7772346.1 nitroreductase family protein [bacterium]
MDTITAIATRTSIRNFSGEEVSDPVIEKLLHAAMAAPSAMNAQPWEFVVVEDRDVLKKIAEHPALYASMTEKASVGILVCEDTEKSYKNFGAQDCAAATQNLLLAAHSLELGAVWTGIDDEQAKLFCDWFSLPAQIVPHIFVPIGIAAEDPVPKKKFDPEKLHYESF